jgi:hypothetical protein
VLVHVDPALIFVDLVLLQIDISEDVSIESCGLARLTSA